MNYKEFNKFCRSLPATTYVIQWGGSHVWKVGGKVFAIGGWQEDAPSFTFKVSDIAYEMLKDQPGLRPAPYLASRGMKWIQHFAKPGLSDAGLGTISASRMRLFRRACRRRSASRLGWHLGRIQGGSFARRDAAKGLPPQDPSLLG